MNRGWDGRSVDSVVNVRQEVRMYKLAVLACAVTTALAVAGVAAADPPSKEVFPGSFSFDDTSTCPGITIHQSNEERDTVIVFSPTRVQVQRHGIATMSANGKTLTSNFSAKIMFDPTTTVDKVVGTVYNVQVPGHGTVLLDAGNIVFDFSTDPLTVLHVGGPHQQFSGDVAAFCSYLA
jgi:hypothetical protein